MTAQIFFPETGRRYLVHVQEHGGYKFIGMVTGHNEETVTVAPCRTISEEASALMVVCLPDEVVLSRLNAAFEEWQ